MPLSDDAGILGDDPRRWQQYHQLVALLPSQTHIDELVAVFFSEANWHVQILDPVFFNDARAQWLAVAPSTNFGHSTQARPELMTFPGLLFQVLAVALLYLPSGTMTEQALGLQGRLAKSRLSEKWSNAGSRLVALFADYEQGISAVEHDLTKALLLKSTSRALEAWKVLGKAIRYNSLHRRTCIALLTWLTRQAQALGLHLKSQTKQSFGRSSQGALSLLWEIEYHRRLWITLFAWDRLVHIPHPLQSSLA